MTDPPAPKRRSRRRTAALGVLILMAALLVALALAWTVRRTLAREALVSWFETRGVAIRAEIEAIGPNRLAARISLGDPARPDFAAERVDVRYRIRNGQVEVLSATLTAPVARARLGTDGRLSMGALDAIIREVLSRPRPPDAPLPDVILERGRLLLATPWGSADLAGDARFAGGRIRTVKIAAQPARLRGAGFDVETGGALLDLKERPDGRLDLILEAPVSGRLGEAALRAGQLRAAVTAPHPDLSRARIEGGVEARASLTATDAAWAASRLSAPVLRVSGEGRITADAKRQAANGMARASLSGGGGTVGAASLGGFDLAATATGLSWDGARGQADLQLRARAANARAEALTLAEFDVGGTGPVRFGAEGAMAQITARLRARGRYAGLGAAPPGQDPMAAIRRAARDVRIEAPEITLALAQGAVTVGLPRPAMATAAGGGRAELRALGARPVFGPDGGALDFRLAGGGLPEVAATLSRIALTDRGLEAAGRATVAGDLGLARDARLAAAGRLDVTQGGALSFTASDCVSATAGRLEFGESDVTGLAARLCPSSGPLLSASGGSWRLNARAEGVTAEAPFAQVRLSGGRGLVAARGQGSAITLRADVAAARLTDTAPQTRFQPLALSGEVGLSEFIWRADLAARLPAGPKVGLARITHDGRLGLGVAVFETEPLVFAEGGLQPADLSPLAAAIGPPVTGETRFTGRFDWAPEGASSSGRLSITRLDFVSPAGPVEGLRGAVAFSSLAPLAAAPGQELVADALRSTVLITGLRARFEIADTLLKVEGGQAEVGGGRVRIEALEAPFSPGAPTRGVLVLDGVQLRELVEASPFGDKVDLDAKVSGRVPFEAQGQKVRITGGELRADQPGRLSINRTALTGVAASGAAPPPIAAADPNATFTDFAYQAMEHLAFDALTATIASRADGRLGVLFEIKGRHDPPTRQEIRLTPADIVLRRFMGKPLPLPSGTGVNLTLDTTLNLDDLWGDWSNWRQARGSASGGSGPIQP